MLRLGLIQSCFLKRLSILYLNIINESLETLKEFHLEQIKYIIGYCVT